MVNNNLHKIKHLFNWENIVDQYEEFAVECFLKHNNERVIPY